VIKTVRWGASACVAALALALNCGVASAQQQKAPEAPKTAPAKKAPAPVAKKAAAPACKTLKDEAACKGGTNCQWVAASKTKLGKEIKAYCRTAPKAKAPAAKAPAKAPAAPKAEVPKAPTAPAKKN